MKSLIVSLCLVAVLASAGRYVDGKKQGVGSVTNVTTNVVQVATSNAVSGVVIAGGIEVLGSTWNTNVLIVTDYRGADPTCFGVYAINWENFAQTGPNGWLIYTPALPSITIVSGDYSGYTFTSLPGIGNSTVGGAHTGQCYATWATIPTTNLCNLSGTLLTISSFLGATNLTPTSALWSISCQITNLNVR